MLVELCDELGISGSVEFLGRLDIAQMANLYRCANVMLNTSTVDNSPNSVIEALTFNGTINYSMEEMKIQIGSVYPLIKEKARNLSCFVDYSDRLLVDNFTDSCCHVNERGNREISSMLSSTILTLINRD